MARVNGEILRSAECFDGLPEVDATGMARPGKKSAHPRGVP